MIDVEVDLTYTPRVGAAERAILQLPNKVRNLRVVLRQALAPAFVKMEKKHFDSKGAAFGHPWAPWAPATRRKRIRKGTASKGILVDSEKLLDSLTKNFDPELTQIAATEKSVHMTFVSRVPYAIFHQLGAPANNMPARQVIPDPLPESFRRQVRAVLRGYLIDDRAASAG